MERLVSKSFGLLFGSYVLLFGIPTFPQERQLGVFQEVTHRAIAVMNVTRSWNGSGTIIDGAKGYALTNKHVCNNNKDQIKIVDMDREQADAIELIISDDTTDLCLIKYKPEQLALPPRYPLPLSVSDKHINNEQNKGLYYGYPDTSFPMLVALAIHSESLTKFINGEKPIAKQVPIKVQVARGYSGAGASGSGVIDDNRELIGVIVGYRSASNKEQHGDTALLIPISEVKRFLKEKGIIPN